MMVHPTPESAADIAARVRALKPFAADLFERLAACSTGGPGITRDTFGTGEQAAHTLTEACARSLGFETRCDAARNLTMTLGGDDRDAPCILMGSHLDSVPRGGNFDGAAGVIAGLVAMQVVRDLGVPRPFDVATMAIRAEESIWFEVSYIGSRSAFGKLPTGALEARRIDTGRTLAAHMADCGADVEALREGAAAIDPAGIRAFIEMHIEQAPQLVEAQKPFAIGTGVPGNFRHPNITISGEHAHVGLPRRFRKDAVLAASDFARGLDDIWVENEAAGKAMAFTIGRLQTDPERHGLTIVPGAVTLSLDVRAYDAAHLDELEGRMGDLVARIEHVRGVSFDLGVRASAPPAPSAPELVDGLSAAALSLGHDDLQLASPASHDAATFGSMGVPTAMLFVRNENGSHNPNEAMDIDDFLDATATLTVWLADELARG